MTSRQVTAAWWRAHFGRPYWRPGNPGTRFGDWGYDCSGSTEEATDEAQTASGIHIPTNSADAARWAMRTGRAYAIRNARQAKPFDLVVYDRYGVPQDGYGSRGHIAEVADDGIHTWESAGATGVSVHDRGNFWQLAIDMTDIFGPALPTPTPPPLEDDVAPNNFFCHTDETTAPNGAGPGAQWWCVDPDANTRIRVVSPAHQKWLATLGGIRLVGEPGKQKPDMTVVSVPAEWLYAFVQ